MAKGELPSSSFRPSQSLARLSLEAPGTWKMAGKGPENPWSDRGWKEGLRGQVWLGAPCTILASSWKGPGKLAGIGKFWPAGRRSGRGWC